MASLNLRFLYIFCNDLEEMRHFYSDLLNLNESYYVPGIDGGLAYQCDGLQFTILPSKDYLPVFEWWHFQPGWQGGTNQDPSWSIESDSLEEFSTAITRLIQAQTPAFFEKPRWLGYWSFPTKDPMGNTVELTFPPEHEPQEKSWQ
jgi:catechol 2,3-dioxygenase-like lactoylglutathione lyase family enzyme